MSVSTSLIYVGFGAAEATTQARSLQERGHRHKDDQAKDCKQRNSGTRKPGFDLEASSRTAQTPFAEVFTVIGQQPIAVFPHTRSGSADDFSNLEIGWGVRSHPDALSAREMRERNFFHRSSAQTVREPRVVNDLASTDVDAVMQIAAPRCDKVRTQRGFLVPDQEPVSVMVVSSPEQAHGSVYRTLGARAHSPLPAGAQAARSRTL